MAASTSMLRWIPRFSLRTLLILTVLIGSGITLWWRWQPWQIQHRLSDGSQQFTNVGISEDARTYNSSNSHDFMLWNSNFKQIPIDGAQGVETFAYSHDGKMICCSGPGYLLRIWNTLDGSLLKSLKSGEKPVIFIMFSADDKNVLASTAVACRSWNIQTGTLEHTLQCIYGGYAFSIIALSKDLNSHVISDEKKLHVLKSPTGSQIAEFPTVKSKDSEDRFFFIHDGKGLVQVSGSWSDMPESFARVLDVTKGLELNRYKLAYSRLDTSCYSDDRLVTARNGSVHMYDIDSGVHVATFHVGGNVNSLAISRDNSHLILSADAGVLTYHLERPEKWWGAAWLPEFWMTVVFSFGLIWSVWRDRRGR